MHGFDEIALLRRLHEDLRRRDLRAANRYEFRRISDLCQKTGYLGRRGVECQCHRDLVENLVSLATRSDISLAEFNPCFFRGVFDNRLKLNGSKTRVVSACEAQLRVCEIPARLLQQ